MKPPSVSIRVVAAAVLMAALSSLGAARQDPSPALDPVMLGQGLTLSAALHAQAERDYARLRRGGRLSAPSAAAARTRFVPSLARRRSQAARFMAGARKVSPDLAKSLAPAFRGDPVRYAAPAFARFGLHSDDVADATALYLAAAWKGANGRADDPNRAQVRGLRDQLRRAFAGASRFARASNATKQEIAEGSLYLAFLNEALMSAARAHPDAAARMRQEIAAGARATFGLDLARMKLTTSGLRPA